MIFLTDKSVRSNLKKFGITSYDPAVMNLVNQYLENYTKNTIAKATKQNKNLTSLEAQHVFQAGGRTVLPSEYFGVESGSYFETLKSNGTDMAVTNSAIRPTVATYDLSGAIKSGGSSQQFKLPKKSLQYAISEAKVSLQRDLRVRSEATAAMQQGFEKIMSEILQKSCGARACQQGFLSEALLKKTAGQRKFRIIS